MIAVAKEKKQVAEFPEAEVIARKSQAAADADWRIQYELAIQMPRASRLKWRLLR